MRIALTWSLRQAQGPGKSALIFFNMHLRNQRTKAKPGTPCLEAINGRNPSVYYQLGLMYS
ncbi:MAG: hypothetical protein KA479_13430 [Saprospiraceae bacterium]|nr:hypothetical protein [Saprospiraceae bacterium]